MTKLSVIFLGTSSATPTKSRSLPSIAIRREGEVILMDCGEGAQRQFVRHGLGLNREMVIAISHLHGDHVNGLLGLLQTMSMTQRLRKITIIAPSDLFRWLRFTMKILHIGLTFDINFIKAKSGLLFEGRDYRITAQRADHAIESYAYLFEELPRPGIFNPNKAKRLGIPMGEKWSRLQHGKRVVVAGKTFRPIDVLGPKRPGRKVGYSGDTRPSQRLARFFRGADILVFDSTFLSKDMEKALERMHSTALEAARLAKAAGVNRLVLTHFSARYRSVVRLLREAKAIFEDTVAAHDGLEIEVAYPES
ncbi:MAG: ribonuclease Z [Thaumarchaeota archaeon]|nr:ribonuclease Z [Nitrososphaerota archaeon]